MRRAIAAGLPLAGCSSSPMPPLVPASRAPAASADWWNGAVVCEVFVRSFRDPDGDGHGDLQELVQELDNLNGGNSGTDTGLGVDATWLMPIYPSPSCHGHDVASYDDVSPIVNPYGGPPGYGTLGADAGAALSPGSDSGSLSVPAPGQRDLPAAPSRARAGTRAR